jgi:hypothetical protein
VPDSISGKIKVVGQLEGWPFPVKVDPTVVEVKASTAAK